MCRLLCVKSGQEFAMADHLQSFAEICRTSREYQGHGWGMAWRDGNSWLYYKNLKPVWEEDFSRFGSTSLLLAHARSAFRDQGIALENNMPFYDNNYIFVFNGELRGVRIKAPGRIGAEKIFNFIKRFDKGDIAAAVRRAVPLIQKQSRYVRAMNFMIACKSKIILHTLFNEDEAYFRMHMKKDKQQLIICSDPYGGQTSWQAIDNFTVRVL